jgi:hypothetical protein
MERSQGRGGFIDARPDGFFATDFSVVSQQYFAILAKVQIDLDPILHHSCCQTGMLFSERRYAHDLPPMQHRDPIFGMIGTKALGPTRDAD